MKIVACGDLHLTDSSPKRRLDDYSSVLMEKFLYIVNYTMNEQYKVMVLPGDIFDTHRASNQLISTTIKTLSNFVDTGGVVLGVLGQHDLAFRSPHNSPVRVLEAAGIITMLSEKPFRLNGVSFYGSDFGSKVPDVMEREEKRILVIHKMISDRDYWGSNLEYSSVSSFLKENGRFDIVISGDNHHSFDYKQAGRNQRVLINAGSLGRRSIDQIDHKPCFYVVDTDQVERSRIEVPIQNNVFDLSSLEGEKRVSEEIAKFVDGLAKHSEFTFTERYEDRVVQIIESNDIEPKVKELVYLFLTDPES
jgi:DNA repair exonuclease SbcCD nuclease subunit